MNEQSVDPEGDASFWRARAEQAEAQVESLTAKMAEGMGIMRKMSGLMELDAWKEFPFTDCRDRMDAFLSAPPSPYESKQKALLAVVEAARERCEGCAEGKPIITLTWGEAGHHGRQEPDRFKCPNGHRLGSAIASLSQHSQGEGKA
jgi:hypothetical protein